jgi:glycine hydroxymethyltransferase
LLLIDLRNIGITGKEGEERLDRVGLTVNKNTVPFETESAFVTSGVRLGTPAITTRGLVEGDMQWLGKAIAQVLKVGGEQVEKTVRGQVEEICRKYPLYNELG